MARGVSVNGSSSYETSDSDHGPCLYLGQSGQRCNRLAVEGGFCELHQPGATVRRLVTKPSRVLAAILGILGVLWPIVADFVHEISRWIHH